MPEAMLYFGNRCNRDCWFCCVEGSPAGRDLPFAEGAAEQILDLLLPDARIKLYGGEPTLHVDRVIELVRGLRRGGYLGRLTIFSNGIQADRLIRILEADPPSADHPGSDAYLNHYIWHGLGVDPVPPAQRAKIERWARTNPGRIWLSHEDLVPVGGAAEGGASPGRGLLPAATPDFGGRCARCWPTVKGDGRIHACAFAAEVEAPHLDLGRMEDGPGALAERHAAFLRWVEEALEPAAHAAGEAPCVTCLRQGSAAPPVPTG